MMELSEKEQKWFNRLKKYLKDYKGDYVCSWWLRIEYEHEENALSTSRINYILSKVADKGLLSKETTKSYTKFSLKN